jgi:hypothetical protein
LPDVAYLLLYPPPPHGAIDPRFHDNTHLNTPHSVGLLWKIDRPDADNVVAYEYQLYVLMQRPLTFGGRTCLTVALQPLLYSSMLPYLFPVPFSFLKFCKLFQFLAVICVILKQSARLTHLLALKPTWPNVVATTLRHRQSKAVPVIGHSTYPVFVTV